jgi:hypothetical protein
MFPFGITAQLEATPETINDVLARLKEASHDLCLGHVRIISYTDDIPVKAHSFSASAFAGCDIKSQTETVEESAAVGVASDINLKFISFGQQLQCASIMIATYSTFLSTHAGRCFLGAYHNLNHILKHARYKTHGCSRAMIYFQYT